MIALRKYPGKPSQPALLAVAATFLLGACATSDGDTTPAPPALASTLPSTSSTSAATTDPAPAATSATSEPATPATLSFASDVQPIIEANCSTCHQDGGIGAAHAPMSTAGDVAEIATFVSAVTKGGYMPPWPAAGESPEFKDSRRLSPDDIDKLVAWVEQGAPLDVPTTTPLLGPEQDPTKALRTDLTVQMPIPFAGDLTKGDEYQCFVLEPALPNGGFITGYQFLPDDVGSVHHVILRKESAEGRAAAEASDAETPEPGWPCAVGGGGRGQGGSSGLGAWVPGQGPRRYPEGLGAPFRDGDFVVAQIHYNHAGHNHNGEPSKATDQSSLTLQFAEDPSQITPIGGRMLLGPMEMPCPVGETAPLCDREAAKQDVIARWGETEGIISEVLAQQCGLNVEELAAQSDGRTARTVCDHQIDGDVTVFNVMAHMHEFGSSFRMTLNPESPDAVVLLDIPTWRFGWQLVYELDDHVDVKAGDTIRIECAWDRSAQPEADMRYVMWAEGTQDEMCFSSITFYPTPD